MKNLIILLFAFLLFSIPQISEASNGNINSSKKAESLNYSIKTTVAKTTVLGGGKRDKNGKYRKKKGFLWGLFKGKNQCDCPKH